MNRILAYVPTGIGAVILAIVVALMLGGCVASPCDQARISDTGIGMWFEYEFCQ